jgi:hypothetical protein
MAQIILWDCKPYFAELHTAFYGEKCPDFSKKKSKLKPHSEGVPYWRQHI